MHVKSLSIRAYKRFSDFTIEDLPATVCLVVMAGPNGGGKSSLLDAFLTWHGLHGRGQNNYEESYHHKTGLEVPGSWGDKVRIEFHEPLPTAQDELRKLIYVRSGYRNESDFTINAIQRLGPVLEGPRVGRTIDADVSVSQNYARLVSATIEGLYSGRHDEDKGKDIREHFIGKVRESMQRVFEDLILQGPGDPMGNGSFFFEKGVSRNFHYKNLSAGEKAAFDLLLDLHVKVSAYDNTIFFIDEPELHMHARLQSRLLEELYRLIPRNSQLWIATHSVGMLRKAQDLWRADPSSVAFLDFHDQQFDQPVRMKPAKVSRQLWLKHLGTAVDDLSSLVAPSHVILCEGGPDPTGPRGDFDARCYRAIFGEEHPEVEFISVGNDNEVLGDRRWLGRSIQALIAGATVTRLVDRDNRTEAEIATLRSEGARVLSRRHLEAYLLEDEVLAVLCSTQGKSEALPSILEAKANALKSAKTRGAADGDVKSAAGEFCVTARKILGLPRAGSTVETFLSGTLAPLLSKARHEYDQLESDVFGANVVEAVTV